MDAMSLFGFKASFGGCGCESFDEGWFGEGVVGVSVTIILLSFYYSLIWRHAALSAAFSFHLDLLLFTLPQRSLMASFL